MSKVRKISFILFGGLFIILATLFFFYDLEISKLLVQNKPDFLFVLLAAIGEFPIYIGPVLFGLVYGATCKRRCYKLCAHFVGLIACYIACRRLCNGILEQFYNSQFDMFQNVLLAIAALIIYVFLVFITINVDKQKFENLKSIALLGLISSIVSFALVSGMKMLWGRARFRSLSEEYTEYTNFLTVNGFSKQSLLDDYQSFPSGHTNSASCILILIPLVRKINSKSWINWITIASTALYVFTVGLSRICVGAHYASDVLFGFGIFICSYILVEYILKKRGWLDVRSDKR